MRILYLSHRFPFPPTFGSKVRAFHSIRHLAQQHHVTVMALAHSRAEVVEAQGIQPHCQAFHVFEATPAVPARKMAIATPARVSASEAYIHSFAMQRAVAGLLATQSVDLVIAHCSSIGRCVVDAKPPKLADFCDGTRFRYVFR